MPITLNTYGIRSVNSESFNANNARDTDGNLIENIPLSIRDFTNTLLRINNLTLNILGYIPGIKQISGSVRMSIGGAIIFLIVALGSPSAKKGVVVGRWYREALLTGIAQITRGALEAFIPFGCSVNLSLDIAGTICNLNTEFSKISYDGPEELLNDEDRLRIRLREERRRQEPPYSDPEYPVLLSPLYLA